MTRRQSPGSGTPQLPRRVLIVECSRRKRPDPYPLPAISRYDGPTFRVLRKYLDSRREDIPLAVFVLSAELGLISSDQEVDPYDRRMTLDRARELRPSTTARMAEFLDGSGPVHLLVCCGQTYLIALDGLSVLLLPGSVVSVTPPRPGERIASLYDWLYDRPPDLPFARAATIRPIKVSLRGASVEMTTGEALERGRRALALEGAVAARPSSWCVDLDGELVSPKWLVGRCVDLPVGAFGTSDALRVLAALGIPVRRVRRAAP